MIYQGKGFRRRKTQRKTNKKQGKYNNNKDYTNNKYKWLTINDIQERIGRIRSEWNEGEYSEILKKMKIKGKRWYDILQEVYSIKKKKINEKTKEEIKEKQKTLKKKTLKQKKNKLKTKTQLKK